MYVAVLLLLFTLGWVRLRRLGKQKVSVWRLVSYWLGLLVFLASLISPVDRLGGFLLFMHMIQHMMLAMIAPPLLLSADPMPILVWGLPQWGRKPLGRLLFAKSSPLRTALTPITKPFHTFVYATLTMWVWHEASLYDLALRQEWVHNLEHIMFFGTAMLLWWHITACAPHWHKRPFIVRLLITVASVPANMIVGIVIALATKVIYTHYLTVPFRLFGLSALDDQAIGGTIMWASMSEMFAMAAAILVGVYITRKGKTG